MIPTKHYSRISALFIGALIFSFSTNVVFAAPAQRITFFQFISSIPRTLKDNIAYLEASANISRATQTAQVSNLITTTTSSPTPTSTPGSLPPLAPTSTLPSGFIKPPVLAGTKDPSVIIPTPPASQSLTIANLRQEFLNELASTRAELQANIFNTKQASPIPGVSFAQSFQSIAPTLLSNLNNLHAGGDLTIEQGNLNILSPNYGMTITSGTITITSGALSVPTITSNSSFTGSPTFNATTSFLGNVAVGTSSPQTSQFYVAGKIPSSAIGTVTGLTTASAVVVQGRYAYVARDHALQVIDVSNPEAPVSVTSTATSGFFIRSIDVKGKYAYLTSQNTGGLEIFDISNPGAPVRLSVTTIGNSTGSRYVTVQGKYAYVTNNTNSLGNIVDVSNPLAPVIVGSLAVATAPYQMYVQGSYAYVANITSGGLQIFDISNPSSSTLKSTVALTTPAGVYVQGRYAYVAEQNSDVINIIDISNVASPTIVSTIAAGTNPDKVFVQGRYMYTTDASNALRVFDVSSPSNPIALGSVGTGSSPLGLYVVGRYVYVTNLGSSSLTIFDMGGSYIQSLEAGTIESGGISVRNNLSVSNDGSFGGGLVVGRGAQISGPFSVYGSPSSTSVFGIDQFNNVAIGTTKPSSTLHIVGVNSSTISLANSITGGKRFDFRTGSIASGTLDIFDFTSSTSRLTIDASGNIGIGTTQPSSTLHVVGTSTFTTSIFTLASSTGITFTNATGSGNLQLATLTVSATSTFNTAMFNATTSFLGNVAIGTSTPQTSQFYVAGRVPTAAVGSVGTGTAPERLFVQGRYAYVTNQTSATFQVFDISNPTTPLLMSTLSIGANPRTVYVQGKYAYVTSLTTGALQIIDVSNPTNPVIVGSVATTLNYDVYVQGRYAYLVGNNGFEVVDVGNPVSPIRVGVVSGFSNPRHLSVQGSYAYVSNEGNGIFSVVSISNPTGPFIVATTTVGSAPEEISVQGRYAYVSNFNSSTLQILDISNPAAPTSTAAVTTAARPYRMSLQGRYLYLIEDTSGAVHIFDISDPTTPTSVGSIAIGGQAYDVAVQGRYAYTISRTTNVLQIFDVGGAYIQQLEAGGIETGTLSSRGNVQVGNDLDIKGGLIVGRGVQISGPFSVYGSPSSTSVFAIDYLNRVGIGTSTPTSTLHLYSSSTLALTLDNTGLGSGSKRFDFRIGSIASGTLDIFDFTSSTSRLTIDASGNIGIGTTQPSSTLHVAGNFQVSVTSTLAGRTLIGTSTQSAINGATSTLTVCAISNCTKPSASTSTDTVSFFASTDGTTAGSSIIARGTITGGQADFGEYITVVGDASTYHAGDVLRMASSSSTTFEKSSSPYDPHLAGVVTETAGFIAGGGVDNHGSVVIALVGRVPVAVSLENGPIHIGDPLTASSQPGVAMLQTEPGVSLGSALEELTIYNSQQTTSTQKIMAFVKTGFSIGTLPETLFSTSTPTSTTTVFDSFTNAVRYALQKLGASIKNGVAYVSELVAGDITAKNKLCVGSTCIDEEKLKQIIQSQNVAPAVPVPALIPEPSPDINLTSSTSESLDNIPAPVVDSVPATE